MDDAARAKRNLIAQWAFDVKSLLLRFHLYLEDVDIQWLRGEQPDADLFRRLSFLEGSIERALVLSGAITALGTQLFGRYAEGAGLDKAGLNQVKKDADAISAYALSECLWYLSRQLPENHAIMVCLGEGLMPKAGETPEMGSNPQLGFGRIYARPRVAQWLEARVTRLINDSAYGWDAFYTELREKGLTIWGAAIDTLENTSRFARGADTGPLTVIHIFDQPLRIVRPYEGYMGNLFLPREVAETAADHSILLDFRTPRELVVKAIEMTYPAIQREHIHVWTLGGKSRVKRISALWDSWRAQGVHLVEDGWLLPNGMKAFTESGTYAPTYLVGTWTGPRGETHLFICDGYAASAEAVQAASLGPLLDLDASIVVFTSRFSLPLAREMGVMRLDPEAPDFARKLGRILGREARESDIRLYTQMIHEGQDADLPLDRAVIRVDDLFPEKNWDVLAISGYMKPDPYTNVPGVKEVDPGVYEVTVRATGRRGDMLVTFKLRLNDDMKESRLVFNPLLNRFMYGENYRDRAVRISDSGRIRNELQTLCTEALEHIAGGRIRVVFDKIPPEVISFPNQAILLDVLRWYKENHPIWFKWLEIQPPSAPR